MYIHDELHHIYEKVNRWKKMFSPGPITKFTLQYTKLEVLIIFFLIWFILKTKKQKFIYLESAAL